jgi:hypothetical protein
MPEMVVYPTFHDKLKADIYAKFPWVNLHFRDIYVDIVEDAPQWIYPVVVGPEDYQ